MGVLGPRQECHQTPSESLGNIGPAHMCLRFYFKGIIEKCIKISIWGCSLQTYLRGKTKRAGC